MPVEIANIFLGPVMILAAVMGIVIGSFLNVVIWRLPRGGSLTVPRWSYCPKCEHKLSALDLVPVLSFLFLGAKCRYCRASISWRYPSIELFTGILFFLVSRRFGVTWETPWYCVATAAWVAVLFIDLEHFVIPDGLNAFGIVVGVLHNVTAIWAKEPGQWGGLFGVRVPASVSGLLLYAGIIYGLGLIFYIFLVGFGSRRGPFRAAWSYVKENLNDWLYLTVYYAGTVVPALRRFVEPPEPLQGATVQEIQDDEEAGGMGGGDGKLAAGIGATLYVQQSVIAMLLAPVIGAAYGVLLNARSLKQFGSRTPVPFGPGMVAGAYISLLYGHQIVAWYVKSFLTFPDSTSAAYIVSVCYRLIV